MASTSSNPTSQGPFAIKLAKPGFDAKTATDYELSFSSLWPSLAIAFSKTISVSGSFSTLPRATIAHGLGFPPFTMSWVVIDGICVGRYFPDVDTNNVYLNDASATDVSSDGTNVIYYIQCYNLDISKQAAYNFIAPPPAQIGTYDPHWVIKFAKPAKSVDSPNLNDFILHSRATSPAVLAVWTTFDQTSQTMGGNTISFVGPTNYTPWVFGYGLYNDVYIFAPLYSQAPPRLFFNQNANSFYVSVDVSAQGASLIALRDPLFVANSIRIIH